MSTYWITTDVDGTLLDHNNYSSEGAWAGLQRCGELGIPVILNTSKTLGETLDVQHRLGIDGPVIIENGSALVLPDLPGDSTRGQDDPVVQFARERALLVFGIERRTLLAFIKDVRSSYNWQLEGFNDWSIEQIAGHTGLSPAEAERAAAKQFSEPFLWLDSAENMRHFERLVNEQGFCLLKGGRFYHLQGHCTKATPLVWLKQNLAVIPGLQAIDPNRATLLALGDSDNDRAMLEAADIAVCIKSPAGDYPQLADQTNIIYTRHVGPWGWSEAVLNLTA